jgi:Na+-translocating ferredoxin:NAD+ oxidoreductase RnfD subunit
LARFLRTPKGTVLWVLAALTAVAMIGTNRHTLPNVLAAVAGAAAAELLISALRGKRLAFPSGALISGMIIAMVLARETPPYVPLAVGALAVVGKHAIRTRWSNVFNPAVLALLVGGLLFRSGQSWWGALPYDGMLGFALVFAARLYIAAKVNKVVLALSFLTMALIAFAVSSFFGAAAQVAQVFRAPDINALFFFAAIMLTDPPSSPARREDQIWFGAVAGALAVLIFLTTGVQWFIFGGLPVANALESLRRVTARRGALAAKAAGGVPAGAGTGQAGSAVRTRARPET